MDQGSLFEEENKPVECFGMTFESDDERREYFRNELRKKLPDLKKIEGFPIGEDEDIIELSDPPYYTACPNPWLDQIVSSWTKKQVKEEEYHRTPYVNDIIEGKSSGIYRAHKYHTKVPHKAIMRLLLHYTEPGDIVFDGFCGTGMTGVAASLCGNYEEVKSLGFEIDTTGKIKENGESYSRLGGRKAIISDLSPAASFIASNYNYPDTYEKFEQKIDEVIRKLKRKFDWMYSMTDEEGEKIGVAEAIVWSDVFVCNNCGKDIVFWENAIDKEKGAVKESFECYECGVMQTKRNSKRKMITELDPITKKTWTHVEQIPVLYSGIVDGKRVIKEPSEYERNILNKINTYEEEYVFKEEKMPLGMNAQQANISHGFESVHHYYSKRNLICLNELYKLCRSDKSLLFAYTGIVNRASMMNRIHLKNFFFGGGGWNPGEQPGTLQIASIPLETSVIKLVTDRKRAYKDLFSKNMNGFNSLISVISATNLNIPDNSIDYVFVDPPFGANINYSELNFMWESWLKVKTNNEKEAIENSTQSKGVHEYQDLMKESFKEIYRILKPNRWVTVEFSNTNASVWNAIQSSMNDSGLVIANVSALDKKQGGFKSVVTTTAVKQDLVISAYKPSTKSKENIYQANGREESLWLFIDQHLTNLPIYFKNKGVWSIVSERTPRILFDRAIAYCVQAGILVPISSAEFQEKVAQKYVIRDGMIFLESQVAEYDKKRMSATEFAQQSLFVSDESSAIEWIRQQLLKKPQSRQDLHPRFMREIQYIAKHETLPELDNLLSENFLFYGEEEIIPDQITTYLRRNYHDLRGLDNKDIRIRKKSKNRWYVPNPSKQADLEKLREKSLLREFNHYREELGGTKKKLKVFRTEAIRTGFKKLWSEKNYKEIVEFVDHLPEKVIQEDEKLLMYYDNATIRLDI